MTDSAASEGAISVVQSTDPRYQEFVEAGCEIVGESWGARLSVTSSDDLDRARWAVANTRAEGFTLRECMPGDVDALARFDRETEADYPVTPATIHQAMSAGDILSALGQGARIFGAYAGVDLVATTMTTIERGGRAETEFTAVHSNHRRRGLATGVKAFAVVALAESGVREFGTGGAVGNEGILRANQALGYVLTERWASFRTAS